MVVVLVHMVVVMFVFVAMLRGPCSTETYCILAVVSKLPMVVPRLLGVRIVVVKVTIVVVVVYFLCTFNHFCCTFGSLFVIHILGFKVCVAYFVLQFM